MAKNMMDAMKSLSGSAEEKGESKSYESKERKAGAEKSEPAHKPKKKVVDLGKKGSFSVRPGALHRALGVPEGQKLGPARISAALHSKSPAIRKMARSAKGLTAMKHDG